MIILDLGLRRSAVGATVESPKGGLDIQPAPRGAAALILQLRRQSEGLGEVFLVDAMNHPGLDLAIETLDQQGLNIPDPDRRWDAVVEAGGDGEDGGGLLMPDVAIIPARGDLENVGRGRPRSRSRQGEGTVCEKRDGDLAPDARTGEGSVTSMGRRRSSRSDRAMRNTARSSSSS